MLDNAATESLQAQPADAWRPVPPSLLDQILAARAIPVERSGDSLPPAELRQVIDAWLASLRSDLERDRDAVVKCLARDVARIDALLGQQLNLVLHHAAFQRLESAWRSLDYLVSQVDDLIQEADTEVQLKVRVLNIAREELLADMEDAVEFDRSLTFRNIYDQGIGMPGGHPFGLLIGDYEFANHVQNDVRLLERLAEVAAASFCPIITSASPALFELDSFEDLNRIANWSEFFDKPDFLKWNALRDSPDARFLGLALPRLLLRLPYEHDGTRRDGFRFRENVDGPDERRYLWGSAAFAFAAVVARAFAETNWFAEIRGSQRAAPDARPLGKGVVGGLSTHSFGTDRQGLAVKSPVEISIDSHLETALSTLGFMPLCTSSGTRHCVFYSNASLHRPPARSKPAAPANEAISAMLQYVLCVSRFAHFVKVIARGKLGSIQDADGLQSELSSWLHGYVADVDNADQETRARYPLREAAVEVRDIPSDPGNFRISMRFRPHFQLDAMSATLELSTNLVRRID